VQDLVLTAAGLRSKINYEKRNDQAGTA
jgi:hypothetical protein